mgnify:CR=1 FL=1
MFFEGRDEAAQRQARQAPHAPASTLSMVGVAVALALAVVAGPAATLYVAARRGLFAGAPPLPEPWAKLAARLRRLRAPRPGPAPTKRRPTKLLQGSWCEHRWSIPAPATPRHEWGRPCDTGEDEFARLRVEQDEWRVRIRECRSGDDVVADAQENVFRIRDEANLTADGYGLFALEFRSTTSRLPAVRRRVGACSLHCVVPVRGGEHWKRLPRRVHVAVALDAVACGADKPQDTMVAEAGARKSSMHRASRVTSSTTPRRATSATPRRATTQTSGSSYTPIAGGRSSTSFSASKTRWSLRTSRHNTTPMSTGKGHRKTSEPRPVTDKAYVKASIAKLGAFLRARGYGGASTAAALGRPTGRDFEDMSCFLFTQLDARWARDASRKFDDDFVDMFKRLHYPFGISRTALAAVGTAHTWPPLLAALLWLADLISFDEGSRDRPAAAAHASRRLALSEADEVVTLGAPVVVATELNDDAKDEASPSSDKPASAHAI